MRKMIANGHRLHVLLHDRTGPDGFDKPYFECPIDLEVMALIKSSPDEAEFQQDLAVAKKAIDWLAARI